MDDVAAQTDSYFLKTKAVVGHFGDRPATYAVFMRRPVICAPRFAIEFLEKMAAERGQNLDIELSHPEGSWVGAGDPIFYIGGSLFHLVDLETVLLQKLGPTCVAAYNAYAMCADLPKVASWRWMRALRRGRNGGDDGLRRGGRLGGGAA